MATLQIDELDDRLYEVLSERATRNNRSMSQEVVTIIEDFFSIADDSPPGNME